MARIAVKAVAWGGGRHMMVYSNLLTRLQQWLWNVDNTGNKGSETGIFMEDILWRDPRVMRELSAMPTIF
jgi:hypothetical protein